MAKSADAFRTISEVADWLDVPAHVLRFWESKFTQVKPVKRAGGRRYYRPADMRLLAGIKRLLHDEGMTIKGVQKMLREEGVHHVSGLAPDWGEDGAAGEETGAQVITFARAPGAAERPEPEDAPEDEPGTSQGTKPEETMTGREPPVAEGARDVEPAAGSTSSEEASVDGTEAAPEPEPPIQEVAALGPLPDLPDDPPDRPAAGPGPLARLARLPRPLPAPLARRLAALADQLRARSEPRQ